MPRRTSEDDPNVDGEKLEVVKLTEREVERLCMKQYVGESG